MRSHTYDYTWRQVYGILAPILAVFLASITVLHLIDWAGWPPLRVDEGGIRHQVAVANSQQPAQIVFVGDSTCWCAIDPQQVSAELPGHSPAVNLSLFVWFDLGRYAQQAADFAKANPGQVKWVVLLVCAGKLSGEMETPDENAIWQQLAVEDRHHVFWEQGGFFTGPLLRERWTRMLLPETLRGHGASQFGFTRDLNKFMAAHNGAVFDCGNYQPIGQQIHSNPWQLGAKFEPACRDFRSRLAPDIKLAIGLTPAILGSTPPDSREAYIACLQQWNAWIKADLVLSNLPAALPASCFAPGGHVNETGQRLFTSAVARELADRLQ